MALLAFIRSSTHYFSSFHGSNLPVALMYSSVCFISFVSLNNLATRIFVVPTFFLSFVNYGDTAIDWNNPTAEAIAEAQNIAPIKWNERIRMLEKNNDIWGRTLWCQLWYKLCALYLTLSVPIV